MDRVTTGMYETADRILTKAERKGKLSAAQRRDVLLRHTRWTRAQAVEIVRGLLY